MGIEKFSNETMETPRGIKAEEAIESPVSPEASKEEIFGRWNRVQAEIAEDFANGHVKKFAASSRGSAALNFVPIVNTIKFGHEAASGKTWSGRELGDKERMLYAVSATSGALMYALLAGGYVEAGAGVGTASFVIDKITGGAGAVKEFAAHIKGSPEGRRYLEAASNYLESTGSRAQEIFRAVAENLSRSMKPGGASSL